MSAAGLPESTFDNKISALIQNCKYRYALKPSFHFKLTFFASSLEPQVSINIDINEFDG